MKCRGDIAFSGNRAYLYWLHEPFGICYLINLLLSQEFHRKSVGS